MRRFWRRLLSFLARGRAEDALKREMDAHLALMTDEFQRKGLSPEEARLAALRAFGGVEQAKETQRDARSFVWLEDARRDVSYAARTLRRSPGFTITAIVTLGLGIGAVTVIYSVLRNVLLEPFPYRDNDRMVDVVVRDASDRILRGPLPAPEFLDYQEQSDVFEDVAGALGGGRHYVAESGAERLSVVSVTPNTFAFLGVRPLLGRALDEADARPGAPPAAVLNHRTWMTLFGGERSVLGRTLFLDSQPVTIVGIMPPRFEWHVGDLWVVTELRRTDTDTLRWFQAYLRPGVTTEQAAVQLNAIAARRAREFPDQYPPGSRIQVITVIDWVVGRFRGVLYTLFGAVGLLLLIACCNVANMLLARATTREREVSVRAALGASRSRIVRQLMMENLLLAGGGAALGCLLALGGIRALARILPRAGVAWEVALRLDVPVFAFALGATLLATLAFGLFPAVHGARRELMAGAAAGGSRGGTASRSQSRMRNGLVIAEVALSLILLFSAGLLSRTFVKLVGVDLGFDPRNLLLVPIAFAPTASPDPAANLRFYREMLPRLNALPGVLAAGAATGVHPFGGFGSPLELPGRAALEQPPQANMQFCDEGYARALGLRLVSGRLLSEQDVAESRKVAVVNETLARQHLGGQSLGRMIRLPRLATIPFPVPDPTFEVVGVVRDAANGGVRDAPRPQAYVPYTLRPGSMTFALRTTGEPLAVLHLVRREIRSVDPRVALVQPATLESRLQSSVYAQPRFTLVILAMFSITGVLLVGLGVYGVMAYTVSQQTRQIAIRMALGGERRHVLRMVLRGGMSLLGAGVAAGLAASLVTNRLLESQLWQLSPHDPATLAGAVAIVAVIGIAACWVPARRATRVPIVAALRGDE